MSPTRRIGKKDKQNSYYSISIILLLGFVWITFNKSGIVKWFFLYHHKQEIINQITELKTEEAFIREHNIKLEDDMSYIEFLAYSKYKMVRPGEKIFRIQDLKNISEEHLRK